MIVSIEWLKEFVDINEPVAELADLLTNAGLEAAVTEPPVKYQVWSLALWKQRKNILMQIN